jgi:uncharacterized membrane protein
MDAADVKAREAGPVIGISGQARRVRALHPPLTDFPIAAYVFAATFDVISTIGGPHRGWATQMWHAGTFVLVAGLGLCLLTMLSGFVDLLRFPDTRPRVTRTVATHVAVMAGVFMIGSGDIAWRLAEYGKRSSTPAGILVLSLIAAVGVCVGAAYGGTLAFRYGVGVAIGAPGSAGADPTAGQAGAGLPAVRPAGHGRPGPATAKQADPGAATTDPMGTVVPLVPQQATRHRPRRDK